MPVKSFDEVIVAVVDNGVHYSLLSSYAKSKLYVNDREIVGNGIDDDRNGRVDDIRGPYTGSAANNYLLDPFGTSSQSHGRSMTNNIVNYISSAEKISGQVVNTSVMQVPSDRWFSATLDAIENGARVVSLSLGFTSSNISSFRTLASFAKAHDALIVIRNISTDDLGEIDGKDHIIEMGFLSHKKAYGTADSVDFLEQGRTINDASESHAISKLAGKIASVWGLNPNWTSQEVLSILKQSTHLNHEVAQARGLTADMGGQIDLEKAVAVALKAKAEGIPAEPDPQVPVQPDPQVPVQPDLEVNTINVRAAAQASPLVLNRANFSSYDSKQDVNVKVFDVSQNNLSLTGNSWKKMVVDYNITEKTILSFNFKTTVVGEIHGIGIDTDNKMATSQFIQLAGTQSWADHKSAYTGAGEWQTFRIELGKIALGDISYLTFGNDDDKSQKANSQFSNIRLYEDTNGLVDSLYSGTAGEDIFDFNVMPGKGEHFQISGFNKNTDHIDISDLLQGYDPVSDAITDFVQITTSGRDSIVRINSDGVGNDFTTLATIVGVTGLTDEAALVRGEQLVV